jgi:hypothetical protein
MIQEPIMSATTSVDVMSLMSSFGVDVSDLNSTDLLAELVIDTFDQWSNPVNSTPGTCSLCVCCRVPDSDPIPV